MKAYLINTTTTVLDSVYSTIEAAAAVGDSLRDDYVVCTDVEDLCSLLKREEMQDLMEQETGKENRSRYPKAKWAEMLIQAWEDRPVRTEEPKKGKEPRVEELIEEVVDAAKSVGIKEEPKKGKEKKEPKKEEPKEVGPWGSSRKEGMLLLISQVLKAHKKTVTLQEIVDVFETFGEVKMGTVMAAIQKYPKAGGYLLAREPGTEKGVYTIHTL